jgi:uncharacterized protein (TIGR02588 family)
MSNKQHDNSSINQIGGRKLAEWITLAISVVIVGGVAVYLIYQSTQDHPPQVPARVELKLDELVQQNGQYIVPVEVTNNGRRTIQDFTGTLTQPSVKDREFKIDFLGERASQKVYFYFDQDPRQLQLAAQAASYRLE